MQTWLHTWLLAGLAVGAAGWAAPPARAAGPIELRWGELVPPPPPADAAREVLAKLAALRPMTPRTNACPAPPFDLVIGLSGKRVRISGFVVPFDGDEGPLKAFLLIAFAGACDKFPPPRNQMILVTFAPGLPPDKIYDPVDVTGVLRALPAQTKLGSAGYQLAADAVAPQH